MLPRWHILLGLVFSLLVVYMFPVIGAFNAVLIFLASVLIDFDHYITAARKKNSLSIFDAFDYYKELDVIAKKDMKKGIKKLYDFHVFHTLEFHLLVLLLGLVWNGFFFIFLGMLFHSIIDIITLTKADVMHMREFFLINWIRTIKNKKNRK